MYPFGLLERVQMAHHVVAVHPQLRHDGPV